MLGWLLCLILALAVFLLAGLLWVLWDLASED